MEIDKVISQLKDLIKDRRSLVNDDEDIEWDEIWLRDIKALNQAMEIVYKAIPKAPINSYCPSCKRHLRCPKSEHLFSGRTKNRIGDNYCPSCGQAIDWSSKDEL